MTTNETKKFIDEYFEALKGPKDQALLDRYISEQDQDLKDHIEVFEMSFPGYQLIPEDIIVEGDKASIRFTFVGEHKGEFMNFPPSNNEVRLEGMIIYQVQNQKIVNHWMVVNMADMMQQIQKEPAEVL